MHKQCETTRRFLSIKPAVLCLAESSKGLRRRFQTATATLRRRNTKCCQLPAQWGKLAIQLAFRQVPPRTLPAARERTALDPEDV